MNAHAPRTLAICTLASTLVAVACSTSAGTSPDTAAPVLPAAAPPVADPNAFPDEAFRASQPPGTQPRPFQLPGVQQFSLANGIDVYLVERHELPIISASLSFGGGDLDDPVGKTGRASVCMDMLTEGTKKLDKLAFDEALADVASGVNAYAGNDRQGITFRTLSNHLDTTFDLFADALRSPAHRKPDFDRLVKRRVEGLKQMKGSVTALARRVSDNVLYGEAHPEGQLVTEKTLGKLRVSDCTRHHREFLRPEGARLFVVGDITQAQITAKFDAGLPSWKGKPKSPVESVQPKSRDGKIFFIDVPGAAQSAINIVHFGPARQAPDYFANDMMSAVLGGGFSSRINMNLRENKGYSYGARGSFQYEREHGVFAASTSVRSDSTHQSILEFFAEIGSMKSGSNPITAAELDREKNGEILGLPARFATARDALRMYADLVYYDLPLDYYNRLVDEVSRVTLAQVVASAATHLRPEEARIIVVGDGKAAMIRHQDGQDVPLLDPSGQPVSLLTALRNLAAAGTVGQGTLVILDADGDVVG